MHKIINIRSGAADIPNSHLHPSIGITKIAKATSKQAPIDQKK